VHTLDIRPGISARRARLRVELMFLLLFGWLIAQLSAQAVTISTANDSLRVHATGFGFIKGAALTRLKEGQSVRVDLEMNVLSKSGGAAVAKNRQTFVLSYDLWEERFAATQPGTPPRSVSHLTSTGVETWCLDQLTVPLKALGAVTRDAPFWIRLAYRFLDGDVATDPDDVGFTLRGLIDAFSRRRTTDEATYAFEAGPFRLP
jgi:hypothetical protein